jgi:hypothetical protein
MSDTTASRAAIRLACQYRTAVNGGLSMALLKLEAANGLLSDEDPLPWPEDDPVWFEHALSGLEAALTASLALQDAIRTAMVTTEADRDKAAAHCREQKN